LSSESFIRKWQAKLAVAGHIECWTILERGTWQLLEAEGLLSCPIDRADDDPMFQQAYEWMKLAMINAGIRPPAQGLSPWWCWIRRGIDSRRPYIEDLGGLIDPVVLQMSIPAQHVVPSCFDLWHYVLNRWYVSSSEEDEVDFDHARNSTEKGTPAGALLEARLRESWPAVFDLDRTIPGQGPFETKSFQGCFWNLQRAYVTAVLEKADLISYE
jgi:hypothetical protein